MLAICQTFPRIGIVVSALTINANESGQSRLVMGFAVPLCGSFRDSCDPGHLPILSDNGKSQYRDHPRNRDRPNQNLHQGTYPFVKAMPRTIPQQLCSHSICLIRPTDHAWHQAIAFPALDAFAHSHDTFLYRESPRDAPASLSA